MNKNFKFYLSVWAILFVLFNAVAFLSVGWTGIEKYTPSFFVGYIFIVLAFAGQLFCAYTALKAENLKKLFYNIPVIRISYTGLVFSFIFGGLCMLISPLPYWVGALLCVVVLGLTAIAVIKAKLAGDIVSEIDDKIKEKTLFVKLLISDAESLMSEASAEQKSICKKVYEAIRYSDPVSVEALSSVETQITLKFEEFSDLIKRGSGNAELAGQELITLINDRNKKCKVFKNFSNEESKNESSGTKALIIVYSLLFLLIIFCLIIMLVIIPNSRYDSALTLYEAGNYEQALSAFEKLGEYKDSKLKCEKIKEKILDEKYLEAENAYIAAQYIEAMQIYRELDDYKDSKDKIEQIYNKLAKDGEIYFGIYKDEPICWEILRTDENKILLITKKTIETLAFNNELKNVTYENSSIRSWLNEYFIKDFTTEQRNRIIKIENGMDDYMFLLTSEQYESYFDAITFADNDWWLRTKTDAGIMFVDGESGVINTVGESVIRNLGVRPCVWLKL